MNLIYKIVLILLLGIAGCKEKQKDNPPSSNKPEPEIDNIHLISLNNSPVSWDDYRGKTVFLNFWATWCKPCLEEMPSIQAAMKKLEKENIAFVFVSDETTGEIENFKKNHPYNFNYLRSENMNELNIIGLPTTKIFNSAGKQRFSEMGFRNWNSKGNIELLLKLINTK